MKTSTHLYNFNTPSLQQLNELTEQEKLLSLESEALRETLSFLEWGDVEVLKVLRELVEASTASSSKLGQFKKYLAYEDDPFGAVMVAEMRLWCLEILEDLGKTKEAVRAVTLQRYTVRTLADRLQQAALEEGNQHLASWVYTFILDFTTKNAKDFVDSYSHYLVPVEQLLENDIEQNVTSVQTAASAVLAVILEAKSTIGEN